MQHGLGCSQKIAGSKKTRHSVKGISSAETRSDQSGFDIKDLPLTSEKEDLMSRNFLQRTIQEKSLESRIIRLKQPRD